MSCGTYVKAGFLCQNKHLKKYSSQTPISLIVFFYQLDGQILYFNIFIILLYMFRALLCSSSGYERILVTCVLNSHLKRVTIPDAVLTQFALLRKSTIGSKNVEEYNKCIKIKNVCIKLVKKTIIILGCSVNQT